MSDVAAAQGGVLTPNQAARRQKVIDAAFRLSERREFGRIQVRDVAEEASVALGTVYHYFTSKEHLFAEVLVDWAGTLEAHVIRRPLLSATPRERLTEVLHRSVRAFQRTPHMAALVARLEMSSDPYAAEILVRLERATSAVYRSALEGLDPEMVNRVVWLVDMALSTLLRSWSMGRLSIVDVYERLDEVVALVLEDRELVDQNPRPPVPSRQQQSGVEIEA